MLDVVSPYRMLPGTVTQVAGRLLKILFDGKPRNQETSYQWISCDSGVIYPAGYAEMVGINTQGLPQAPAFVDQISFT